MGASTTAKLQFFNLDGMDAIQMLNPGGQTSYGVTVVGGVQVLPQLITASGAVNAHYAATSVITKAGVAVLTLAAPVVGNEDGLIIPIISATANAHTLTATGLFQAGIAGVNVATFLNLPGAGLTLMAYQGKWLVLASQGITFS